MKVKISKEEYKKAWYAHQPDDLPDFVELEVEPVEEKCTCGQPTYHEDNCALTKEIADQPKKIELKTDCAGCCACPHPNLGDVCATLRLLTDAHNKRK